jgi:hypothetical protein
VRALLLGGAFHLSLFNDVAADLHQLRLPLPKPASMRDLVQLASQPYELAYDVVTYQRVGLDLAEFYPDTPADSWWAEGEVRIAAADVTYSWGPGGDTAALMSVSRAMRAGNLLSKPLVRYELLEATQQTVLHARWVVGEGWTRWMRLTG